MQRLPSRMRPSRTEERLLRNQSRVGRPASHDAEEPRWLDGLYEVGGLYDPPRPLGPARRSPEQFVKRLKELRASKGMQLTIKQLLAFARQPESSKQA